MRLIPAMSIRNGRTAIVEDGRYRYLKDPVSLIQTFESPEVFVLDLNGIETNTPDLSLLTRLAGFKDIWVDAGPQTVGGAMDVLISGASKVVVGTKSLQRLEHAAEAVDLSENVIFSLDYDNAVVISDRKLKNISIQELVARLKEMAVTSVMLFDLGGIRDSTPTPEELINAVTEDFPESYLIGKVTKADIPRLEQTGLTAIIVDHRTLEAFNAE